MAMSGNTSKGGSGDGKQGGRTNEKDRSAEGRGRIEGGQKRRNAER
jgi:hypothetical protein